MEIIDFHTHIWPGKVAEKAKDYLEKAFNHKMVDLPVSDNLLRYMDEAGVSKSVISSVASRPEQVISINNWLFSIKHPRFIPFASLHPFFEGFAEELKRIKDNALGIKLQPEFQNFFVDDERVFKVYEQIEKQALPILFHCGVELSGTGEVKASPERILKVHKKFPNLKIIGAHMGGFLMWEEVLEKLAGENIYFDTSDSIKAMDIGLLKKFFAAHGFDKILFGSDFPMANPREDIDFIKGLDIAESDKQKLLFANAHKLLDI
jgi:predicted TIM-barrel fold metal-dependent hydrolase